MSSKPKIAIIDYGVGNLYSLQCSLQFLGLQAQITNDALQIATASHLILPGVGAFGDAMRKLEQSELKDVLIEQAMTGKPLLGICLGMQLLFEQSIEFGFCKGLGLIEGNIVPLEEDLLLADCPLKVPHMGWNPLIFYKPDSPLLKYSKEGDSVYYVHSYYAADCENSWVATSEYGIEVTGIVQKENVFGTQFHPEKSGEKGLAILKAFSEYQP